MPGQGVLSRPVNRRLGSHTAWVNKRSGFTPHLLLRMAGWQGRCFRISRYSTTTALLHPTNGSQLHGNIPTLTFTASCMGHQHVCSTCYLCKIFIQTGFQADLHHTQTTIAFTASPSWCHTLDQAEFSDFQTLQWKAPKRNECHNQAKLSCPSDYWSSPLQGQHQIMIGRPSTARRSAFHIQNPSATTVDWFRITHTTRTSFVVLSATPKKDISTEKHHYKCRVKTDYYK